MPLPLPKAAEMLSASSLPAGNSEAVCGSLQIAGQSWGLTKEDEDMGQGKEELVLDGPGFCWLEGRCGLLEDVAGVQV